MREHMRAPTPLTTGKAQNDATGSQPPHLR
jgi:hypothetical protein